ncbi:hypothetical protein B9Z45_14325 [Limnohabitans sp. 2KL-17]|nr:hypothetical protein B9Z45_14325 [Limnohabitans sp. 2KL-17]
MARVHAFVRWVQPSPLMAIQISFIAPVFLWQNAIGCCCLVAISLRSLNALRALHAHFLQVFLELRTFFFDIKGPES